MIVTESAQMSSFQLTLAISVLTPWDREHVPRQRHTFLLNNFYATLHSTRNTISLRCLDAHFFEVIEKVVNIGFETSPKSYGCNVFAFQTI